MKIYILLGLPMSGKSTRARCLKNSLLWDNPRIISSDDIRINLGRLDNKYHRMSDDDEKIARDVFFSNMRHAFQSNENIIIDDCQLRRMDVENLFEKINLYARVYNRKINTLNIEYVNTDLNTCKKRLQYEFPEFYDNMVDTLETINRHGIKKEDVSDILTEKLSTGILDGLEINIK